MCHGLLTLRVARAEKRFMNPRRFSSASSSASSKDPERIRREIPRMLTRTVRLTTPMATRKTPEIAGPRIPVLVCTEAAPRANSAARPKTIVEWPSEKKKPTLTGRWPSAMSLRVVLSIAAMWSASKAWRSPSV